MLRDDISREHLISELDDLRLKVVELEAGRSRAQLYFDIAGTILLALDIEGNITRINKKGCRVLGYSSDDEVVGKNWFDHFILRDDQDVIREVFRNLMAGKLAPVEYFENIILTKDGEARTVAWHNTLLKNEDGEIIGTFGSGEDITRRKDIELKLQKSEEQYRGLVETSSDWIWEVDEKGVYTYSSPKVEEMLGYKPDEIIGKTLFDIMPPGEKDRIFEDFMSLAASSKPMVNLVNVNLHKDGRLITIETSGVPVFNKAGELCGYRGVDRDITDRKNIEQKLQQSEEKYRQLFEEMTTGCALHEILCDDNGIPVDYRFLDVNQAFEKLTGLDREKLIGKTVLDVMPGTEKEWVQRFGKVALTGKPDFFENYAIELDKYYEVMVYSPAKGQFAVIFEDVTERTQSRKQLELLNEVLQEKNVELSRLVSELEDKNAELERFTYTVSHDLKSPLITIKGFLGMLKRDISQDQTERIDTDMQRISGAADKMGRLLDELLELSRIGRLTNKPVSVSLDSLISEALELVDGRISKGDIKVDVAQDLPVIFGDRPRLLEVFQNLIDNAAKFMGEQTSPEISIGMRTEKDRQVFYVKDNGIGINAKYHQKIFGLFDQLDQKFEGTGIGLTLVKRIIETHGGEIWVESQGNGQGSAFCFTIGKKESK